MQKTNHHTPHTHTHSVPPRTHWPPVVHHSLKCTNCHPHNRAWSPRYWDNYSLSEVWMAEDNKCLRGYHVHFRTTLTHDPRSDYISTPGPIWPCAEQCCSLAPLSLYLSGRVGSTRLSDQLNCCSQPDEVVLSMFVTNVAFVCWTTFWHSPRCLFEQLVPIGSCYEVGNEINWSHP